MVAIPAMNHQGRHKSGCPLADIIGVKAPGVVATEPLVLLHDGDACLLCSLRQGQGQQSVLQAAAHENIVEVR